MYFLNVLLQLHLLLELHSTFSAAEQLDLVLLLVLCYVEQHRLSSGVSFPTLGAGALVDLVDLFEVPVQRLNECRAGVAEAALPWFVVGVVFMHVVHQPPEPAALLRAELADAELLVVFCDLLLGEFTQLSFLF